MFCWQLLRFGWVFFFFFILLVMVDYEKLIAKFQPREISENEISHFYGRLTCNLFFQNLVI